MVKDVTEHLHVRGFSKCIKCACAYKKYCGKLKLTKYLIKNKHLEDGVTRETFKLQ